MTKFASSDTAVEPVAVYTKIAGIYDRMMIHVNYPRWAEYIHSILRRDQHFIPSRLLDVACGTGRFLAEMEKLDYDIEGCDPSSAMLDVARHRLPDTPFFQCKLPDLAGITSNHYNVVTCLYDSLNYLTGIETLHSSLNRIYDILQAPGQLIFDVVTRLNCRYYFQNYSDQETFDDHNAYRRDCYFDNKTNIQYNKVRIHTPQGVFEETHQQYIFSLRQIRKAIIKETPFTLLGCYNEFTFQQVNRHSSRAHFILRKDA